MASEKDLGGALSLQSALELRDRGEPRFSQTTPPPRRPLCRPHKPRRHRHTLSPQLPKLSCACGCRQTSAAPTQPLLSHQLVCLPAQHASLRTLGAWYAAWQCHRIGVCAHLVRVAAPLHPLCACLCRSRWLKPDEYLTLFTYANLFSVYDTQPKFIYINPVSCVYFIRCNALEFPR